MAKTARGLTITQRPNGAWRAQVRKVGIPGRSKDFLTKREADDWGLARLAELQSTGRLIDRSATQRITLRTVMEQYLTEVTAKRPGEPSRIAEAARLNRFMREESKLCAHAIGYLAPKHFETWRDRRLTELPSRGQVSKVGQKKTLQTTDNPAKTISPGTVKREMTLLKRVFDFAVKNHNLAANPLAAIERLSVQDERNVRLDAEQWAWLLDQCHASGNIWLASFVELAVEIGARRASLLNLRWDDVNLEDSHITLRGVKNSRKPSEIRTVEIGISPRGIEILSSLPKTNDGRVFPMHRDAMNSAFKRARARAGLSHFRFHDTRHELASRLVEDGWGMFDLMKQGDWRETKSVLRYYTARGKHLGEKLALTNSRD